MRAYKSGPACYEQFFLHAAKLLYITKKDKFYIKEKELHNVTLQSSDVLVILIQG